MGATNTSSTGGATRALGAGGAGGAGNACREGNASGAGGACGALGASVQEDGMAKVSPLASVASSALSSIISAARRSIESRSLAVNVQMGHGQSVMSQCLILQYSSMQS